MSKHLDGDEARAILTLSTDPNWQMFKGYLRRLYLRARDSCESEMNDHRFFQGAARELRELDRIEEKAKNILTGI